MTHQALLNALRHRCVYKITHGNVDTRRLMCVHELQASYDRMLHAQQLEHGGYAMSPHTGHNSWALLLATQNPRVLLRPRCLSVQFFTDMVSTDGWRVNPQMLTVPYSVVQQARDTPGTSLVVRRDWHRQGVLLGSQTALPFIHAANKLNIYAPRQVGLMMEVTKHGAIRLHTMLRMQDRAPYARVELSTLAGVLTPSWLAKNRHMIEAAAMIDELR